MTKKMEILEEHGNVLYLDDVNTNVTFFREQAKFIKQADSNNYVLKIKPTSIEIKISYEEYVQLKDFSKPPTVQWLYMNAKSSLLDFFDDSVDLLEAKKKWVLLKKEMDERFRNN
ncbi:MAG: hypothetical protein EOO52_00535 [Gammaproteobacteria bacterium]|nr:MAG: hypothetical protein EOO52_00535 [Gammaproteobacteria bacterium]